MRNRYILRECPSGKWLPWDLARHCAIGKSTTLEEADRAVRELNAKDRDEL